ncbi:MAG: T9SS type A sorting domain-containing protein [Bacteroidia bacterium]|nr:T9SS type A sorting domain-containing protein [Bacteroidota bacterium]MBP6412697.1 T9SS type A sorting domain-containing protein [Bacteroidia bacterium]
MEKVNIIKNKSGYARLPKMLALFSAMLLVFMFGGAKGQGCCDFTYTETLENGATTPFCKNSSYEITYFISSGCTSLNQINSFRISLPQNIVYTSFEPISGCNYIVGSSPSDPQFTLTTTVNSISISLTVLTPNTAITTMNGSVIHINETCDIIATSPTISYDIPNLEFSSITPNNTDLNINTGDESYFIIHFKNTGGGVINQINVNEVENSLFNVQSIYSTTSPPSASNPVPCGPNQLSPGYLNISFIDKNYQFTNLNLTGTNSIYIVFCIKGLCSLPSRSNGTVQSFFDIKVGNCTERYTTPVQMLFINTPVLGISSLGDIGTSSDLSCDFEGTKTIGVKFSNISVTNPNFPGAANIFNPEIYINVDPIDFASINTSIVIIGDNASTPLSPTNINITTPGFITTAFTTYPLKLWYKLNFDVLSAQEIININNLNNSLEVIDPITHRLRLKEGASFNLFVQVNYSKPLSFDVASEKDSYITFYCLIQNQCNLPLRGPITEYSQVFSNPSIEFLYKKTPGASGPNSIVPNNILSSYSTCNSAAAATPPDIVKLKINATSTQNWEDHTYNFSCPDRIHRVKINLPPGYRFASCDNSTLLTTGNLATKGMEIMFKNKIDIGLNLHDVENTVSVVSTVREVGLPGQRYILIDIPPTPCSSVNACNTEYFYKILPFTIGLYIDCSESQNLQGSGGYAVDNIVAEEFFICSELGCESDGHDLLSSSNVSATHHCSDQCADVEGHPIVVNCLKPTPENFFQRISKGLVNNTDGFYIPSSFDSNISLNTNSATVSESVVGYDPYLVAYVGDEMEVNGLNFSFSGNPATYALQWKNPGEVCSSTGLSKDLLIKNGLGFLMSHTPIHNKFGFILSDSHASTIEILNKSTNAQVCSYTISPNEVITFNNEYTANSSSVTNDFANMFIVLNSTATALMTSNGGSEFIIVPHIYLRVNPDIAVYTDPITKIEPLIFNSLAVDDCYFGISCDNYIKEVTVYKPKVDLFIVGAGPGTIVQPCSQFELDVRFRTNRATYPSSSDDFPFEYRPYGELISLNISLPEEYCLKEVILNYQKDPYDNDPSHNNFDTTPIATWDIINLTPILITPPPHIGYNTYALPKPPASAPYFGQWPLMDLKGIYQQNFMFFNLLISAGCNIPNTSYVLMEGSYKVGNRDPGMDQIITFDQHNLSTTALSAQKLSKKTTTDVQITSSNIFNILNAGAFKTNFTLNAPPNKPLPSISFATTNVKVNKLTYQKADGSIITILPDLCIDDGINYFKLESDLTTGSYLFTVEGTIICNQLLTSLEIGYKLYHNCVECLNGLTTCGHCLFLEDKILIELPGDPVIPNANAGIDQFLCNNYGTLSANMPLTGQTGIWTITSGGGILTYPTSPTTTITSLPPGDNILVWTVSEILCSTSQIKIHVDEYPSQANAGQDQSICVPNTSLAATLPIIGIGEWTLVSGSGTITNPTSPTSQVTGLGNGNNIFRWTISNGICAPSLDDVLIAYEGISTPANAGPDELNICGVTSVVLSANAVTLPSNGSWSILSGLGGSFSNPNDENATFIGISNETYVLRWTIENGICFSYDDKAISFYNNPTSDAGPDQVSLCGETSVTLAANTPIFGTGSWSIISGTGGLFSSISDPSATFSGIAGITYELSWTMINGPCSSSDNVLITFNHDIPIANAGPNQTICSTSSNLAAMAPSTGIGTWTLLAGFGIIANPNLENTNVTGLSNGNNIFRWTVVSGACSSFDEVTIHVDVEPTTSNAGPDQTDISTCGLTSVTLSANAVGAGESGSWSIISGNGGSFSGGSGNPSSSNINNPVFTGLASNIYTLRWTIQNGACTNNSDDMEVILNQNPTSADAGPDQVNSNTCGVTQITLAANTPIIGTGSWSVVTGLGGSFGNSASPNSTFTGIPGIHYTLRWTISNAPCTASTDDVEVTFNSAVTGANAGPDISICYPNIKSVTLQFNAPSISNFETATYSIVSGNGTMQSFPNTPGKYKLTISTPGVVVIEWKITRGLCSSSDQVIITANSKPSISISPSTATINPGASVTLTVNGPSGSYSITPNAPPGLNPQTFIVSPNHTKTYTITGPLEYGCGCTDSKSVTIHVNGSNGSCHGGRTYPSGGYGSTCGPNNPGGCYRDAIFNLAFPSGLKIGCAGANEIVLTDNYEVEDFLSMGTSVSILDSGVVTNPGATYANMFANELVALALNIGFDNYDPNFCSSSKLEHQKIKTGTFATWSVDTFFLEANKQIGGCSSNFVNGEMYGTAKAINENYDNGENDGFLDCGNFTISIPVSSVCAGSTNGTATVNVSSGVAPYDYSWSNGQTTQTITGLSAGDYTVWVTDADSQTEVATVTITTYPLPLVTASNVSGCVGNPITLSGTPAGGTWSVANPYTGSSATYTYTYTDENGCTATSSAASIIVNSLPIVTAENVSGCSGTSIALSGTPSGGTWSVSNPYTGSSSQYTHSYTDANGCSATSSSATITVNALPSVTASANPSPLGDGTLLTLNGGGALNYTWSGGGASITNGVPFVPTATATYTVNGTDANGCSNTATVSVNVSPSTKLNPTLCGTVLNSMNTINILPVSGATNYRLHVIGTGNQSTFVNDFITNGNTALYFIIAAPGVIYNHTYNVSVSYYKNGAWSLLGPECSITTSAFPQNKLSDNTSTPGFCNYTSGNQSDVYNCTSILGANSYEYKIVEDVPGGVYDYNYTWDKTTSNTDFRFEALTNKVQYGYTYDVQVRALVGKTTTTALGNLPGEWGTFGPVCKVTLTSAPPTSLTSAYCNTTLASMSDQFFYTAVSGATNYRLHFTTAGGYDVTVPRNNSNLDFRMTWIPTSGTPGGPSYNTTYNVEVSAYVGGVWTANGPSCTITTPPTPSTSMVADNCNITLSSISSPVSVVPIGAASMYRLHVTSAGYDNTVYLYNSNTTFYNWTTGMKYGTTYNVTAAAYVGSAWLNEGPVCLVNTPAVPQTQLQNAYCPINLTGLSTQLFCNQIPAATNYSYKITGPFTSGSNQRIYYRNSAVNDFRLSWIAPSSNFAAGSYTVEVAYYAGQWENYGTTCTIQLANGFSRLIDPTLQQPPTPELEISNQLLIVYPNPNIFENEFFVQLNGLAAKDNVGVFIYNMLGELVYKTDILKADEGDLILKPEVRLAKGVYLIEAVVNEKQIHKKYVVD